MIEPSITQPAAGRGELVARRKARPCLVKEATVWQPIRRGWQQLYGSFYEQGVSIEWHDFSLASPFEWSRSFHAESLELCLNLSGQGLVKSGQSVLAFEPMTAGFYLPGKGTLQGVRQTGQPHRFLTVEFSASYLRQHLAACDGALHRGVEEFLREGSPRSEGLGEIHRLTAEQEHLVAHLLNPPVFQGARSLWFQSKVLQLMVDFFFERRGEDEPLGDRQKRLARERVDGVISILRRRLDEPPSLEAISREVGCSPFHLSRTFSREAGMTIPQYLRKLRMERAAELLQSGKFNVTEAALEVGYSSLSHFSQVFCQVMGCCPGLYPLGASAAKTVAAAA